MGDYPAIEKLAEGAIKEKQKFERLVVSKEKLLEMFAVRLLPLRFVHWLYTDLRSSTTNIKFTSSTPRYPTAHLQLSIVAGQ